MSQRYPPPSVSPGGYQRAAVRRPTVYPTVTYTLLAITIIVFLLQMASESLINGSDVPALWGMKINPMIIQGQYWRFITPMFLHGGILHIAFNMYALFVLGPGLERYYGHGRFLALYMISGFAGNVFSFLFSQAPSLGSSTAIFGLLGAQGVFMYQNRGVFGPAAQRALINIIVIAGINLVYGLSPGIDNWGHIGGLIGGTLFAWFGGPKLHVEGIYPELTVMDERGTGDAVRAGISTTALFVGLAVVGIFLGNL